MKKYRGLKLFVTILLVLYFVAGFILETFVSDRNEIFPFFSWSLFQVVPNEGENYSIRILSVDHHTLENSIYFQDSRELFPKAKSVQAYHTIQKLGRALSKGNQEKFKKIRQFFEPTYLGQRFIRYEVVKRKYDPLVRWRSGRFKSIESLGVFETFGQKQ